MNERTGTELAIDESKMMEFVGRAVGDVGAVLGGAMVVIGDKLGLYRAMAGAGSLTPAELARSCMKRLLCAGKQERV